MQDKRQIFNNNLISFESPLLFPRVPENIDINYVRTSRIAVEQNINLSGSATAVGTIAIGTHVVVTTTLAPTNPYSREMNLANPFLSIYEGTSVVGSMQFYPAPGSGIAANKFTISSGFDRAAYNGTNSVFRVAIYNDSGSAVPIYAATQWKYIQNNAGTSS